MLKSEISSLVLKMCVCRVVQGMAAVFAALCQLCLVQKVKGSFVPNAVTMWEGREGWRGNPVGIWVHGSLWNLLGLPNLRVHGTSV